MGVYARMPIVTGLGHIGIYVKDPDVMVEFYSTFLGMTVSDRAEDSHVVFLSTRPEEEHHELVLMKDEERDSDAQQISFTVGSLADLRSFYAQINERGYVVDRVINHGNAFGCYFFDPEGNRVGVYWHTGKVWPQPYGVPIDLGLPEEDLVAVLESMNGAATR
jgi:catechol-2,3-dioxygenase